MSSDSSAPDPNSSTPAPTPARNRRDAAVSIDALPEDRAALKSASLTREALIASVLTPTTPSPNASCSICMTPFPTEPAAAETTVHLPCNNTHVFCRACIAEWFRTSQNTCPLCRSPAFDEPDSHHPRNFSDDEMGEYWLARRDRLAEELAEETARLRTLRRVSAPTLERARALRIEAERIYAAFGAAMDRPPPARES